MSVVTVGDFDGVHSGHKELLRQVTRFASEQGLASVVVTFDRNCKDVLRNTSGTYLTTLAEKKKLLLAEGIDSVCVVSFDSSFASMSPEEFLIYLKDHCGCTYLFGGEDFRFGKNGVGTLTDGACVHGIKQKVIELKTDVMKISSSAIRSALAEGLVDRANDWLGYPYFITGTVVEGKHLGRTIGFPTMNLNVLSEKMLPGNGVYITETTVDGQLYRSVTNVGVRPSFNDGVQKNVETHLLNASGDFYGKTITVQFLARLRDERHFSDLGSLMQQLRMDRDQAFSWRNPRYFS